MQLLLLKPAESHQFFYWQDLAPGVYAEYLFGNVIIISSVSNFQSQLQSQLNNFGSVIIIINKINVV